MVGLDGYDVRARLTPGYLALSPLLLSLVLLAGERINTLTALAGLVGALGAPALLASLVRDRGKALEKQLWMGWGGAPATAALRATDDDPVRLRRRSVARDRTGMDLPSSAEQHDAPDGADGADAAIQRVVNELIKLSRNDPVVQSELGDYGMRRNLLGMRDLGLCVSALALAVGIGDVAWILVSGPGVAPVALAVLAVGGVGLVGWARLSPAWVKVAADRYTSALLD